MTSDEQPRRISGQWDVKPQSDLEVVLTEIVDGSFLFPPNRGLPRVLLTVEVWGGQAASASL